MHAVQTYNHSLPAFTAHAANSAGLASLKLLRSGTTCASAPPSATSFSAEREGTATPTPAPPTAAS